MKPGYKTTEFWLTIVAQVVGLLLMSGAFDCQPGAECPAWMGTMTKLLGMASMLLSGLGYQFSRGAVKGKEAIGAAIVESVANSANPPKPPQG